MYMETCSMTKKGKIMIDISLVHNALYIEEFSDYLLFDGYSNDIICEYTGIVCNALHDVVCTGFLSRGDRTQDTCGMYSSAVIRSPFINFNEFYPPGVNRHRSIEVRDWWNSIIEDNVLFNIPVPHLNKAKLGLINFHNLLIENLEKTKYDDSIYYAFCFYTCVVLAWTQLHTQPGSPPIDKLLSDHKDMYEHATHFAIIKGLYEELLWRNLPYATSDFVNENIEDIIFRCIWDPVQKSGHMVHVYPNPIDMRELVDYYCEGRYRYGDVFHDQ